MISINDVMGHSNLNSTNKHVVVVDHSIDSNFFRNSYYDYCYYYSNLHRQVVDMNSRMMMAVVRCCSIVAEDCRTVAEDNFRIHRLKSNEY